jgi:hypothetical protein
MEFQSQCSVHNDLFTLRKTVIHFTTHAQCKVQLIKLILPEQALENKCYLKNQWRRNSEDSWSVVRSKWNIFIFSSSIKVRHEHAIKVTGFRVDYLQYISSGSEVQPSGIQKNVFRSIWFKSHETLKKCSFKENSDCIAKGEPSLAFRNISSSSEIQSSEIQKNILRSKWSNSHDKWNIWFSRKLWKIFYIEYFRPCLT